MKEIFCACCHKKIENEYMRVLDNYLLVKYFDSNDDNIFCSDECLQKSLSVETYYLEDGDDELLKEEE